MSSNSSPRQHILADSNFSSRLRCFRRRRQQCVMPPWTSLHLFNIKPRTKRTFRLVSLHSQRPSLPALLLTMSVLRGFLFMAFLFNGLSIEFNTPSLHRLPVFYSLITKFLVHSTFPSQPSVLQLLKLIFHPTVIQTSDPRQEEAFPAH